MPMLTPTDHVVTINYLGVNNSDKDLTTTLQQSVHVDYTGFVGDLHSALTRASCVRVKSQYPKGTEIRNTRQISALSVEELAFIQQTMQLDTLAPEWVGANLVVEGLHDFSKIPPSSRLIAENGTSLVVDMENAPCRFPGEIIEQYKPGFGKKFPKAALGRRGVTLWVERQGALAIGATLRLHIPPVCNWRVKD